MSKEKLWPSGAEVDKAARVLLLSVVVLVDVIETVLLGWAWRRMGWWALYYNASVWGDLEKQWDGYVVSFALPAAIGALFWFSLARVLEPWRRRELVWLFVLELIPGVNLFPFFTLGLALTSRGEAPSSGGASKGFWVVVLLVDALEVILVGSALNPDRPGDGKALLWLVVACVVGGLLAKRLWAVSLPWRRKKLRWLLLLEFVPAVNALPLFTLGLVWTARGARRERELVASGASAAPPPEGDAWMFRPGEASPEKREDWTFRKKEL